MSIAEPLSRPECVCSRQSGTSLKVTFLSLSVGGPRRRGSDWFPVAIVPIWVSHGWCVCACACVFVCGTVELFVRRVITCYTTTTTCTE